MFHYLDNAATTPVRPEAAQAALEAQLAALQEEIARFTLRTRPR